MKIRGAVLERSDATPPFAATRPISVRELELDDPGPDEVLIQVNAAGLCHSDLSVVNGDRPRPLPMLLGHEASGTVLEVGAGVQDLRIGDQVVAAFLPRCGECRECRTDGRVPCSRGSAANGRGELLGGAVRLHSDGAEVRHHLGVSAFASHAVLHRSSLVAVGKDIPADVAALLGCAVLTGGGAVLNVRAPRPGERVAVIGLGGVGMAAMLTALAQADVEVIAVDSVAAKLARAVELGAHMTGTPDQLLATGLRADIVIEAAGHPRAFETAVAMTDTGGVTITVGLPHPEATSVIKPLGLVAEARSIVGSYLGSAVPSRDIPRFAEMWRSGRLPLERLISSEIELDDINSGMDRLARGEAIRQMIRMGAK